MRVALNDAAINRAKREAANGGTRLELSDAGEKGLRLRITPSGSASWVLGCRDREGRIRRFPLGSWPAIGLSDARNAARMLHVKVRGESGVDPIAERRRTRAMGEAAKAGLGTLSAALTLYGIKRGDAQRAWGEARKRIDLIFKPLLSRPAETLTRQDFQMLADAYPSQSSASYAVRSLRPALKWLAQRAYLTEETSRLHPPAPVKHRKRVLTREELARLLPALRSSDRPFAAAMHFMLLTMTRRAETALARWRDVSLTDLTWIIQETKNGEPHMVPLSRQAVKLLRSRLPVGDDGVPMNPAPDALIFATRTGAQLLNWDRETKAIQETSNTTDWTRHDLRRTGATMLGDMGEMPDIIEAALNHVAIHSVLAATYNRSRYRPQVAMALQRLADALDGIEAGAGQVIPLKAKTVQASP
jgi:integrase